MKRFTIDIDTEGSTDIINLTPELASRIRGIEGEGIVHLFVVGSTAALTTVEFEPGLVKHDLPRVFQQLVPDDAHYVHEATWNDDNGHSHVRAALLGASVTVPFSNGRLLTGEWQQVVLIDFDTRPRRRKVICTVIV
ncbi:secondary thiamine-phosphate synthase enzyme YjbQ [Fontivita pretiosa]|jgi:secondary thiamine-phosphate synthase enzyme|uniref:secondary thiamine-phosphate synthase enzyme YjbQ n=1 Tax=Fontivita pretiosa TaxID=2989684 RepID=UPI003D168F99